MNQSNYFLAISAKFYFLVIVILALGWLLIPVRAVGAGGGMGINPMSIDITPAQPIVPVSISNRSDQAFILQTEVMAWQRNGGNDVYTSTRNVIVTPPIVKVAPGSVQTLRVGLLRQPDPAHESMYRLYITQLPTRKPQQQGIALQIVLRIGIPIWVAPTPAVYRVGVNLHPANGVAGMKIVNTGNAHVKILRVVALSASGKILANQDDIYTTLFPGDSTQLPMPLKNALGPGVKLQVITDPASQGSVIPLG